MKLRLLALHLVAISVYFVYLDVGKFLLLCPLEGGVDAGHVGVDFVIQLSAFLRQSLLVHVHSLQRVKQLLELGVKLLNTVLADYLRNRLHAKV